MSESTQLVYETNVDNNDSESIAKLVNQLEQKEREVDRLREQLGDATEDKVDTRGPGGTPDLTGEIHRMLEQGRPTDAAFFQMDTEDRVLERVVENGPEAFVDDVTPVYAVHRRAHDVLVHCQSLAMKRSADGSTVFLTTPTIKRFLEARGAERLKHTQIRRVFEKIEEAGSEYPRPPVLHKNSDGIVELVIFDYDRILGGF